MATNKEMYRLWLRDVPQDKVFWRHDGGVMRNLEELAAALRDMPQETFHDNVAGDKNDFSNWVRDVVGDMALANQLKRVMTSTGAARKVEARITWLKARL